MHAEIVIPSNIYERLQRDLFARMPKEGAAFMLAGISTCPDRLTLTVRDCWNMPDSAYENSSWGHVDLRPTALINVVNHAAEAGGVLIEAHTHPHTKVAQFSVMDEHGLQDVVPYMVSSLPQPVYGATVWGHEGLSAAVWWKDGAHRLPVRAVRVVGPQLRFLPLAAIQKEEDHTTEGLRADRLDRAIGRGGRQAISGMTFGIVGLGGLGSNLVSALLAVGARSFILIDDDIIKVENLDRIPYALPEDEARGVPKVDAAARYIRARLPDASIAAIRQPVGSPEALAALKKADVIFGGVDSHLGRLVLTNFAAAYLIPFIDCGTGVNVKDGEIIDMGGRITVLWPGQHCLVCAGRINARELNYELADEQGKRFARERGYVTGADVPQPMVGNLNAIIANKAVLELVAAVTGFRVPVTEFYLDDRGQATFQLDLPESANCRICVGQLGMADQSGVLERFADSRRVA